MRKTRHVVLPVRSWQYIGLLIVSLACLTLGHVSRDREGRHGSLAGPELMHTAPHEVDACPNQNCAKYLSSKANASSHAKLTQIRSEFHESTSRSQDSNKNHDRPAVTRLIADKIRENRLEERRSRYQSKQKRFSDDGKERRFSSLEIRDINFRKQNVDQAAMRRARITRETRVRQDAYLTRHDGRFLTLSREPSRFKIATIADNLQQINDLNDAKRREYRIERRSLSDKHRTRMLQDQIDTKRQRDFHSEQRIRLKLDSQEFTKARNTERIKRTATNEAIRDHEGESLLKVQMDRRTKISTEEQRRIRESKNHRVKVFDKERQIRDLQSGKKLLNEQLRVRERKNQLLSRADEQSFGVNRIRSLENRQSRVTAGKAQIRNSQNERRSITDELRVRMSDNRHDSRLERKPLSVERVRVMQNRRIIVDDGEHRVRNVQNERRVVSEEREVRSNENRVNSRVERRSASPDQVRKIKHRQVRITEGENRVHNIRNNQKLFSEMQQVRLDENRFHSRVERLPSIDRLRIIKNRLINISDNKRRIRSPQSERISITEEPRVRISDNRDISRMERMSSSAERVRVMQNRRIIVNDGEHRIRNVQNQRRLVSEERRVRSNENRLNSRVERRLPSVDQVRKIENRQVRITEGERRVHNTLHERKLHSERQQVRIDENRFHSRVESLPSVDRLHLIKNRQIRISDNERRIRNPQYEHKLLSQEQRVGAAGNRLLKNLETLIISEDRHVRNSDNNRRLVSEERVRLVNNRFDTPVGRSSPNVERLRILKNRQIRISESDHRDRNTLNEKRLNGDKSRVRKTEIQLNPRTKSMSPSIERARTIEKRQKRVSEKVHHVHNLQNERRLLSEERARIVQSRLDYRGEEKSPSGKRIRNSEIQRSHNSQAERRIRDSNISNRLSKANQDNRFSTFEIKNRIDEARLLHREAQRNSQQKSAIIRQQNMQVRELSRMNRSVDNVKVKKNTQSFIHDATRSAVRYNENLRFLTSPNDNDVISHRVVNSPRASPTETLKGENPRRFEKLNSLQVGGKKLDEFQRERRVQKRIESANLYNKQLNDIRMKMSNTQYLKSVMSDNNLNYTYSILQQVIILVFCAAYGASIFNKKTGPFRNFAQLTTRLLVW